MENDRKTDRMTEAAHFNTRIKLESQPIKIGVDLCFDKSDTAESSKSENHEIKLDRQSKSMEQLATPQPKITYMFGGPGAGKGTQCDKMVKEFKFTHISTGDIMRAEVASGSQLGKELKAIMDKGELVPLEMTIEVLKAGLKKNPSDNYLFDGFPRDMAQAKYLEENNVFKPSSILYLKVDQDIMVERMKIRG